MHKFLFYNKLIIKQEFLRYVYHLLRLYWDARSAKKTSKSACSGYCNFNNIHIPRIVRVIHLIQTKCTFSHTERQSVTILRVWFSLRKCSICLLTESKNWFEITWITWLPQSIKCRLIHKRRNEQLGSDSRCNIYCADLEPKASVGRVRDVERDVA